jgi:N-acyl-D-aspartate/D-glutamate deacylase
MLSPAIDLHTLTNLVLRASCFWVLLRATGLLGWLEILDEAVESGRRVFGNRPFGPSDRGRLAPGCRHQPDRLRSPAALRPELVHDMATGGRRFVQRVDGYEATLVGGTFTFERRQPTGALPGRLVRAGGNGRTLHAA